MFINWNNYQIKSSFSLIFWIAHAFALLTSFHSQKRWKHVWNRYVHLEQKHIFSQSPINRLALAIASLQTTSLSRLLSCAVFLMFMLSFLIQSSVALTMPTLLPTHTYLNTHIKAIELVARQNVLLQIGWCKALNVWLALLGARIAYCCGIVRSFSDCDGHHMCVISRICVFVSV